MNDYRQLLVQIFGFILVSAILGIATQKALPNGISLRTDLRYVETDSGRVAIPNVTINPENSDMEAQSISLDAAYEAFNAHRAIFFDARTLEEYEQGHIQGAIHLEVEAFMDSLLYLDTLSPEQQIITYCDGADCNASIDLAAELNGMGFSNVSFFFGGWQEWSEAGHPIAGTTHD